MTPTSPRAAPSVDSRLLAVLSHCFALLLQLASWGLFGWLVPLAVWIAVGRRNPFVSSHARAAFGLQLVVTVLVVLTLAGMLLIGVAFFPIAPLEVLGKFWPPGFVGIAAVLGADVLLSVLAAACAVLGRRTRYWLPVPFFR